MMKNNVSTALHPLGNTLLRSPETFAKYHDNPKRHSTNCFICHGEPLMLNMRRWRLIANDFPYDAVASMHMMLAPARHVGTYDELTLEEKKELEDIKRLLDHEGNFDAVVENLSRGRTFMPHYHLHVLQWLRV